MLAKDLPSEWKKEVEHMSDTSSPTNKKTDGILPSKTQSTQQTRTRFKRLQTIHDKKITYKSNTNGNALSNLIYGKFGNLKILLIVFLSFYGLAWFIIYAFWNDSNEPFAFSKFINNNIGGYSTIDKSGGNVILGSNEDRNSNNISNNDVVCILYYYIMSRVCVIYCNMDLIINIRKKRLKVAVAILVTKDPGIQGGFLDSAGALTVSIEEAESKHDITLIALIHKNVTYCVPILKAMGYEIRAYDTPFQLSVVQNTKIAEEMAYDGCCGILEALKLYVWTWTEFDVVLSVDADMHFHKNFDELFELNTTFGWTHGATAHMNQELMNGGFLIVRPNPNGPKHFKEMVDILIEGDFRDGSKGKGMGWKGSNIGWVYGGRTIQGILPYYYLKVAIGDETEVPRCKYNNMVEIDKCRKWEFKDVTSNHFTWYINIIYICYIVLHDIMR